MLNVAYSSILNCSTVMEVAEIGGLFRVTGKLV
jgi:hypothetical protein